MLPTLALMLAMTDGLALQWLRLMCPVIHEQPCEVMYRSGEMVCWTGGSSIMPMQRQSQGASEWHEHKQLCRGKPTIPWSITILGSLGKQRHKCLWQAQELRSSSMMHQQL